MRPRVALVLQLGLFGTAVLLVACIPVTFQRIIQITLPPLIGNGAAFISQGKCILWLTPDRDWLDDGFAFEFLDDPPPWHVFENLGHPLVPMYELIGTDNTFFTIPLWLLAAICLAWPVTSFILARRRHKRGFPVVQTEVRDQKSEVSQMSEAPQGRGNTAHGASPG